MAKDRVQVAHHARAFVLAQFKIGEVGNVSDVFFGNLHEENRSSLRDLISPDHPALKRWAKYVRPYGAAIAQCCDVAKTNSATLPALVACDLTSVVLLASLVLRTLPVLVLRTYQSPVASLHASRIRSIMFITCKFITAADLMPSLPNRNALCLSRCRFLPAKAVRNDIASFIFEFDPRPAKQIQFDLRR